MRMRQEFQRPAIKSEVRRPLAQLGRNLSDGAPARERSDAVRVGAWAGILAPVVFLGVSIVEGLLRPGYDMVGMFISALAMGPRGGIQIASFLVTGLLILLLACGVAAKFKTGKASRLGPILLGIIAVALFFSGPFVMDPVDVPAAEMSTHSRLHYFFGAFFFTLAPATCFVFWQRFRSDPDWKALEWWTLAAGVIATMSMILLFSAARAPDPPNALNAYVGLIQRGIVFPFFLCVLAFSLRLLRRG